ncbi:hypothetical protein U9M48_023265 [Paspalum notatum var. saurae]|uniref:Uncharacterized protein n=1 Tax=Paspalum notatum var. saurae TaxID=547442 RepID=A0AAQ3TL97_PASNO
MMSLVAAGRARVDVDATLMGLTGDIVSRMVMSRRRWRSQTVSPWVLLVRGRQPAGARTALLVVGRCCVALALKKRVCGTNAIVVASCVAGRRRHPRRPYPRASARQPCQWSEARLRQSSCGGGQQKRRGDGGVAVAVGGQGHAIALAGLRGTPSASTRHAVACPHHRRSCTTMVRPPRSSRGGEQPAVGNGQARRSAE